ncbi:hypothetical protein ABZ471_47540 [Streptomyces sp. NPDC005728]|uniref:hypothetical protein n=1 Tax=Streptomyces sp. NPDC005728 TaxID=3157054 RepID=UPI0034016535
MHTWVVTMPIRALDGNTGTHTFVVRALSAEQALKKALQEAARKQARLHRRDAWLNDEDVVISRVRRDGSPWHDTGTSQSLSVTT